MKRISPVKVRRSVFLVVFLSLLAFSCRPLWLQMLAGKEGTLCRIPISVSHGKIFCEGRYLRFHMPKRVRGEFDGSGHGFLSLRPANGGQTLSTFGRVTPEKPENGSCFLRVVRFSRWWDDTISEPFDTFVLPRPLSDAEWKKLHSLSARRDWQLLLKVRDGYASPVEITIGGVPLLDCLKRD